MAYQGQCHCGAVAFSVEAEQPSDAVICNCSHCQAKGFLLAFHPVDAFTLTQGEESLATYMFNRHKLQHRFCSTCGTQPFAEGVDPEGKAMRAVNLRCVPGLDLANLKFHPFDGASL